VFGIPGGAIEPLYNALARAHRAGGPHPIVARHESGAAFMADGYHRASGLPGVCCATTGPGATNLITGVASAYENRVPMLVLTAQTALSTFGRGAFQESSCTGVDTVHMFSGCTRYNSLVSHVDQLENKLVAALQAALGDPPGPAHLSLPPDILGAPAGPPRYRVADLLQRPRLVDPAGVAWLAREIGRARHPVFVLGEGCLGAGATVATVAHRTGGHILTTPHGIGSIPTDTPGYAGVIGFAGHETAEAVLRDPDVDLVVAVGTGLSEWASNAWDETFLNQRLVHVDTDTEHFRRSPMARQHVRGDVATTFARVLSALPAHAPAPAARPAPIAADDAGPPAPGGAPLTPQAVLRYLAHDSPADAHLFADTGNAVAWAIHHFAPGVSPQPRFRLHTSLEFASMGWAIGASVGAAFGDPTHAAICVTGDGAALMAGQELTVAVQHGLPVVFIVLNDGALGMVKHGQRLTGAERIAYELPPVDFARQAEAQGANGIAVDTAEDLQALDLVALCAGKRPTLIDARIDPEQVPPMRTRVRTLRAASCEPGSCMGKTR